jgi:hypothetical protein
VSDADDSWNRMSVWYPDVAAVGDATRAWQAEFDRLGIPLRARQELGRRHCSTVGDGCRSVDLAMSHRERQFSLSPHASGGRSQLFGNAPDLAAAAVAARLWLTGARLGEVAAACPFLGSVALAEARERGDEREHTWLLLYENHTADKVAARLAPFVALAFHEPALRALLPYISVWSLGFGSTPQSPLAGDLPMVTPVEQFPPDGGPTIPGGYVVHNHGRRAHETDARGALALVLAALGD